MSIYRGMNTEDVIIYTLEYYSALKKNGIMPCTLTWMGLETVILSEVKQTNVIQYHLYVKSKKEKNDTNELTYKSEIDPQT